MKRPLQRAEKILLVSTVLLSVPPLILGWIYQKQNELPPARVEKKQVPPAPNAFDLILSAASLIGPLPTAKYSKRGGCLANGIDWESSCNSYREPRPYTEAYNRVFPLGAKRIYLQSNRKSLQIWRQSLSLPLFVPDEKTRVQNRLWNSSRFRYQISVAARSQARADWQRGDRTAALEWLLLWHRDICRSTLSFYNGRNHSNGIDKLNSASKTRGLVMEELERLGPYLDAAQMRHAALKLQENRALLPSRVAALQVSKAKKLDFAHQICERNDLRCYYDFQHPETVIASDVGLGAALQLRFRWANKKAGLKRLAAQWDWLIAQDAVTLQSQNQEMPDLLRLDSSDVFSRMETYSQAKENRDAVQIDAREALFLSAMAARAFALEQGRNPHDLKALVPRYLRRVETDPFASTHSLVYLSQPKTYEIRRIEKALFTLPLPKDAVSSGFGLPSPQDELTPPDLRTPTGYILSKRFVTLPFLLYSVGENGRDGGGLDFRAAKNPVSAPECDDILAPVHWFSVQELEKTESDELKARRSPSISNVGAPPL